ncbi:NUDIX domain-containing protein [Spirosoma daeguense]
MGEQPTPKVSDPAGYGFLTGLAIDLVIFGFHENQLKVLLLEYQNTDLFALPGGFIRATENLNDAARRILAERTGLHDIYLEQYYVFGDYARYGAAKAPMTAILQAKGVPLADDHWLLRRFVSVGYYALVDFTKAIPTPDVLSDTCNWYDVVNLPSLMQDHETMVQKALETLRITLDHNLVSFNRWAAPLLSETFTMIELQNLYETILGQKLHRSGFQRKILSSGILERLDKKYSGGAHKAPYLYRFGNSTRSSE